MAFCKAMTHILIPVRIFFILASGTANSVKQGVRSHVLEFLARILLTCNILSFIIESQVFCLAIFIYMFRFCINKMIYYKNLTPEKQGRGGGLEGGPLRSLIMDH